MLLSVLVLPSLPRPRSAYPLRRPMPLQAPFPFPLSSDLWGVADRFSRTWATPSGHHGSQPALRSCRPSALDPEWNSVEGLPQAHSAQESTGSHQCGLHHPLIVVITASQEVLPLKQTAQAGWHPGPVPRGGRVDVASRFTPPSLSFPFCKMWLIMKHTP